MEKRTSTTRETHSDDICGIYVIKNLINNKVYVGQSTNVKRRMSQHLWNVFNQPTRTSHLYNSFRLYGIDNFEWAMLEMCERERLSERELYWVKELDSSNRDKGYNLKGIDDNLISIPEEAKQKISKALKGLKKTEEHISNMPTKWSKDYLPDEEAIAKRAETMKRRYNTGEIVSHFKDKPAWNKGKSLSNEHKEKLRTAHLGKKRSDKHKESISKARKRKVYQFSINTGELIKVWNSAREIEEETNGLYKSPSISGVCNGNKLYYLDYIFRYESDIDPKNPIIKDVELDMIRDAKSKARKSKLRGSYKK